MITDDVIGAYSNSAGVQVIRDDIARFIEKRDGMTHNYDSV